MQQIIISSGVATLYDYNFMYFFFARVEKKNYDQNWMWSTI